MWHKKLFLIFTLFFTENILLTLPHVLTFLSEFKRSHEIQLDVIMDIIHLIFLFLASKVLFGISCRRFLYESLLFVLFILFPLRSFIVLVLLLELLLKFLKIQFFSDFWSIEDVSEKLFIHLLISLLFMRTLCMSSLIVTLSLSYFLCFLFQHWVYTYDPSFPITTHSWLYTTPDSSSFYLFPFFQLMFGFLDIKFHFCLILLYKS